jgi:hypothetical protein
MSNRPITTFLLRCSGASLDILEECPPFERIKHAGIGATILFTAVLALFSGSYALYTIFGSLFIALVFGVVWSMIIFNLDRLIVSSMRKTGNWFKQLLAATPRLLLAFLIAVVISKPIEIRLLESKINKVLFETTQGEVDDLTAKCQEVRDEYDQRIKEKREEIEAKEAARPPLLIEMESQLENKEIEKDKLEKDIRNRTQKYYDRINQLNQEIAALEAEERRDEVNNRAAISARRNDIDQAESRISNHQRRLRPINAEIAALKDDIDKQFDAYQSDLNALRTTNNAAIQDLTAEQTQAIADCVDTKSKGTTIYNTNSLPDLIVALQKATDEDHVMSLISLFIMLLFIMLETAPVFVKLLAPRGPYDEKLNEIEHRHRIQAEEEIIRREQELKKKIEIFTSIDQVEMEQEVDNNKRTLKTISDAHHELIKEQVNIWLDKEREKIRQNGVGEV